jgi:hypothetical protein
MPGKTARKPEIRNPRQSEMTKTPVKRHPGLNRSRVGVRAAKAELFGLEHADLAFRICLGFGISYLGFRIRFRP